RRHYLLRLKGNRLSPATSGDLAAISIERKYDSFARNGMVQGAQKAKVDLSFCKCRAADNDLRRAALHELYCARNSANASADSNVYFESGAGALAECFNQLIVISRIHSGVEINDVQPGIALELLKLRKDVGNSQLAAAAVDELHGLALLQVDARN